MVIIQLKKLLDERGRSITWLHDETGISKNTLSLMSNNSSKGIQFDTLEKICSALSVTPNDLLKIKNTEHVLQWYHEKNEIDSQIIYTFRYVSVLKMLSPDKPMQVDFEDEFLINIHYKKESSDDNLIAIQIDVPNEKFLSDNFSQFLNYQTFESNLNFFLNFSDEELIDFTKELFLFFTENVSEFKNQYVLVESPFGKKALLFSRQNDGSYSLNENGVFTRD